MRPFDPSYIIKAFGMLLPYTGRTLLVTLLAACCGTFLGVLLALARLRGPSILRASSAVYVHIIRCTPSIVLLFMVYYGLPELFRMLTGISSGYSGKLIYTAVTLSLLFSAAMCELFRSSYSSVDKGQSDAAFCCGFTPLQTARLIIIPQAATAALPVFCSELTSLLKQGALAFTIGFIDLMGKAQTVIALNYGAHGLEIYIALGCIYWMLSLSIEAAAGIFEHISMRGKSMPGKDTAAWN